MGKNEPETKKQPSTNNNNNNVRVNNHFSLTINFGDSLNLLALIGGIYFLTQWRKSKKRKAVEGPSKGEK